MAVVIHKRVIRSCDHPQRPPVSIKKKTHTYTKSMAMMREKVATVVLVLAAVAMGEGVVRSRADGLCNVPIAGLMACKPCVSGPAGVAPTSECCSALAMANWPCLCAYKSFMRPYGIDPERAMQLPSKCNLTSPVKC